MALPRKTQIRVLIVDDHKEFIDRVSARLLKVDPSVELVLDSATSGDEGLKKVEKNLPDVILLDNMLADEDSNLEFINAADFYRALKQKGFHGISVIVITYDPEVHNVKDLLTLGVKAVFNKDDLFCDPDGYARLVEEIKRCVT
jgi:CheY-like chemotaxis protein